MLLLVSDSSVLIDLERGGLLESTFLSGHTLVVPDLLFENELKDYNGNYLKALGLAVTELNSDEVSMAQEIHTLRSGLSLEDCFALVCACRANHILLAGDGLLRKEAATRNIACRGLLWLLDEMLASGKISKNLLCEGINLCRNALNHSARCCVSNAVVLHSKGLVSGFEFVSMNIRYDLLTSNIHAL